LAAAAVAVRSFAGPIAGLLPGADGAAAAALLSTPPSFTPTHAAAAAATAAAVTAARAATLAASPAYRAETDASLGGMLPALGAGSVALWLCAVPAAAEEALFRGALLPLLSPDARGVAAVAALFGVLHASGGRGVASVGFATAAGVAYGALYLAAGGAVAAPALAHALANAAAAGLWWVRQSSVMKGD
jgi:membrane protease YdiL (CAAX protease family)